MFGIKHAVKMTLAIIRERPHMQEYFRTKKEPHEYYAVRPQLEGRIHPRIVWIFRKVTTKEEFRVNDLEMSENFEPCGAFEAIGSAL